MWCSAIRPTSARAATRSCWIRYDPDPARRYKSVYIHRTPGANIPKTSPMRSTGAAGLSIAFSPNGIDWTPYEQNPIVSDWGSDVEILTHDPIDRKYVLYGRADHPWNSTHPDFQAWFATVWPDQPTGIWNTPPVCVSPGERRLPELVAGRARVCTRQRRQPGRWPLRVHALARRTISTWASSAFSTRWTTSSTSSSCTRATAAPGSGFPVSGRSYRAVRRAVTTAP